MGLIEQKISEILFGTDDEADEKTARRRAGRLGVRKHEFNQFEREAEALGILKSEKKPGKTPLLKKGFL